jgi:hypothetical protein
VRVDAVTVWTEPTAYTICAVPETVQDWDIFAITAEKTAPGRWAVRWRGRCLNLNLEWQREPVPSERDDEFLSWCRFDLDAALDAARRMAPGLRCNGITAERAAVEWVEEVL